MSESEDAPSSIDELICDAQDALFENDFDRAIRSGELALQRAPRDADAHEVIVSAHAARGAFAEQHAAVTRWIRSTGSARMSVKLRKYAIEAAFLAAERDALAAHIQLLLAANANDDNASGLQSLYGAAALMCAENDEGDLAAQLRARMTSDSEEEAFLVRLVDAWLLGRVDRDVDSACTLLRQLADDSRLVFGALFATWAEALRVLLNGVLESVSEAEELRNNGASMTLAVAGMVVSGNRELLTAVMERQRNGTLGNVMPVVRRRMFQAAAAAATVSGNSSATLGKE
jgi:hypothetical protein